jgi:hypothetical protein
MAFSVPTFGLTCNLYRGPWTARVLASSPVCNLAYGRRITTPLDIAPVAGDDISNLMQLLLPALTDVRDVSNAVTPDVVEVPAGSGRWYGVVTVDDVGKGFPNEYRLAALIKIYEALDPLAYPGLFWPVPIP